MVVRLSHSTSVVKPSLIKSNEKKLNGRIIVDVPLEVTLVPHHKSRFHNVQLLFLQDHVMGNAYGYQVRISFEVDQHLAVHDLGRTT